MKFSGIYLSKNNIFWCSCSFRGNFHIYIADMFCHPNYWATVFFFLHPPVIWIAKMQWMIVNFKKLCSLNVYKLFIKRITMLLIIKYVWSKFKYCTYSIKTERSVSSQDVAWNCQLSQGVVSYSSVVLGSCQNIGRHFRSWHSFLFDLLLVS